MTRQTGYASRPAFTILEGLTVAGIIMLLMSLAIVAATRGLRSARISSERHVISSIKIGLEQFKRDFDLPPLVDDAAGRSQVPVCRMSICHRTAHRISARMKRTGGVLGHRRR